MDLIFNVRSPSVPLLFIVCFIIHSFLILDGIERHYLLPLALSQALFSLFSGSFFGVLGLSYYIHFDTLVSPHTLYTNVCPSLTDILVGSRALQLTSTAALPPLFFFPFSLLDYVK